MENNQDILSLSDNPKKLPEMLNVLTILTFVGCGIGIIFLFLMPMGCKMLDNEDFMSKMTASQIDNLKVSCDNMMTLIIISILGTVLCFLGALFMRKLKQNGYLIYLAGQILPLIGSIAITGFGAYSDWKAWLGLAFVAIFIILYTTQRKHLVN